MSEQQQFPSDQIKEQTERASSKVKAKIPNFLRIFLRKMQFQGRKSESPISTAKPGKQLPRKKVRLSRRDIFKIMGVGTLLLAEEATLGFFSKLVLEPVEGTLRDKGVLIEGNAGQFMLILRNLISEYLRNPTPESHQLIAAWLKFNAAAQYANHSQKEIAGTLAFHFLYGEGQQLDITNLFTRQLDQLFDELFSQQDLQELGVILPISDEEKVNILFEQMLSEAPVNGRTGHFVWVGEEGVSEAENPDTERVTTGIYARQIDEAAGGLIFRSGTPSESLQGIRLRLFGVANLSTENSLYGLAQFTSVAEGTVVSTTENSITLHNPQLYLRDQYDWLAGTGFDVETTVGQIIEELGAGLLFQDNRFNELKNQTIRLTDDDGALLVDRGYAHIFEVYAGYQSTREVTILNSLLERPQTDYLTDMGAIVIPTSPNN